VFCICIVSDSQSPFRPPDGFVTSYIDDSSASRDLVHSPGIYPQSGMMSLLYRSATPTSRIRPIRKLPNRVSSEKSSRRVTFDPLSLLLHASQEGDLDLVMSVIGRVSYTFVILKLVKLKLKMKLKFK